MNEREILMRKIATTDFAITDLHLFLDSHPNNEGISKKLNEFQVKSNMLKREYEEKFGPIQMGEMNANRWAWIAGPWPWECEERGNC